VILFEVLMHETSKQGATHNYIYGMLSTLISQLKSKKDALDILRIQIMELQLPRRG
jgi:hypothetical protein